MTAVAGRHVGGSSAAVAASVGAALAVTGGAGATLDVAHDRLDTDGDGHFFPAIPRAVELGIGGAVVGGLALKYGKQGLSAMKNAKLLAGSAAESDAAGAALGELIPRSQLTIGPRMFLGARISHGFGSAAKRVVMPHQLESAEVRAALGLATTGTLAPDELAAVAIRSMEHQGAYEVDTAGRAMVDLHLMGSPTGMGGLNVAPVMTAEQLVRTATYDAQYGARPSVQSLGKVDEALDNFVALARAHKARMAKLPEGAHAPTVGIATSLGGLQFDQLIAKNGPGILDDLGLDKVVSLGAPVKLSKLDPSTLPAGFHIRTTLDKLGEFSDEQLARARFIEIKNADDPVPLLALNLLDARPSWFPAGRRFTPGVSFAQHGVDITAAISRGTGGTIGSGGHEYRSVQSNAAFARALGLRQLGRVAHDDAAVQTAGRRAEEASVAEAKRARDVLLGGVKKPA